MEYNPDLVPCGSKPRPSTDPLWSPWWSPPAARPPCSYYLHRRPPRLHLREDLLRVSVYRCRTRALDSLFKNQTVINHVNRKSLTTKTVLRVLSPKIDENNFGTGARAGREIFIFQHTFENQFHFTFKVSSMNHPLTHGSFCQSNATIIASKDTRVEFVTTRSVGFISAVDLLQPLDVSSKLQGRVD